MRLILVLIETWHPRPLGFRCACLAVGRQTGDHFVVLGEIDGDAFRKDYEFGVPPQSIHE
jgi:hypothetical protein